jgi:hypothetical protein
MLPNRQAAAISEMEANLTLACAKHVSHEMQADMLVFIWFVDMCPQFPPRHAGCSLSTAPQKQGALPVYRILGVSAIALM